MNIFDRKNYVYFLTDDSWLYFFNNWIYFFEIQNIFNLKKFVIKKLLFIIFIFNKKHLLLVIKLKTFKFLILL